MTDTNCTEEEKKEEVNTETTTATPEQIANVRKYLIDSVKKEYHKFLSVLQSIPMPQQFFTHVYHYMDNGMLWLKEAIEVAPFEPKKTPEQKQEENLVSKETSVDETKSVH